MSTYHITRFVLDHALRDALRSADAGDSAFWQAWLRGVVRMFRDRTLPPGLRAGLLREAKDTALAELVNNLPEVSRGCSVAQYECMHALIAAGADMSVLQ